MNRIISHRCHETVTEHRLSCYYVKDPSGGFSFPCDSKGNVEESTMQQAGRDNLALCRSGMAYGQAVSPLVLESEERIITHPAVARCDCGHKVVLDGWTNSCDCCEREYSMGGSLLAPRSQWGEETGEQGTF